MYQLIDIYNTIIGNLYKGKNVCFVFCDLAKAFAKVWHRGLIHKLCNYGIKGNILRWIEQHICDREQQY